MTEKTLDGLQMKAIPALGKKLNAQEELDAQRILDKQEEYGIDLIAICSFGDELEYPFFAFAQCTVAKEWWVKRHMKPKLAMLCRGSCRLDTDHTNFLLIPHFPRINATEWREPRQHTINCILCDRYRICRLLEKSNLFTRQEHMPPGINKIFQEIQEHLPESH